jgi:hypothetical protein
MGDYRKLELWNRSHQLALAIYRATGELEYLDPQTADHFVEELDGIKQMLSGLIRRLMQSSSHRSDS